MKTLIAVLTAVLLAPAAVAESLQGCIRRVESNLDTFDPDDFTSGHFVDVWEVVVHNPNDIDATSLLLTIPGAWVNNWPSPLTFRDSAELPTLGPHQVAETFFVLPPGMDDISLDVVDDDTLLTAAYTVVGSVPLVPAQGDAVVAVLSTPVGDTPNPFTMYGRAAVGGLFDQAFFDFCVPEPAAATLFGIGLFGYLTRSRRRLS